MPFNGYFAFLHKSNKEYVLREYKTGFDLGFKTSTKIKNEVIKEVNSYLINSDNFKGLTLEKFEDLIKKYKRNHKAANNPLPNNTLDNYIPDDFLAGIDFIEDDTDLDGLHAPFKSKDIYKMVTDRIIKTYEKLKGQLKFKSKWNKGFLSQNGNILSPANFFTKKRYNGLNAINLTLYGIENNYEDNFYLSFKQVEKLGGKVKKGAKAIEVVYYTKFYSDILEKDLKKRFKTTDAKEFKQFLIKNNRLKEDEKLPADFSYPILKYSNVFHSSNIEGIDFNLSSLSNKEKKSLGIFKEDTANEIAELIIKNYKEPKPKILEGVNNKRAFYSSAKDFINMPDRNAFNSLNDFYATLFHECIHSTGHNSRLNRKIGNKFGSFDYAWEELVAEFGSILLSSWAGILWTTEKNRIAYLQSWGKVIEQAKKDDKLLFKISSIAQRAVDYILQPNDKGEPLFYKDLKSKGLSGSSSHTISLADRMKERKNFKPIYYNILNKNFKDFLGDIEQKNKESVVITLTGGQGSMKTRFAFQFINALAENYKVGHASIEEHPESNLYWEKVLQYIDNKNLKNIINSEIKNLTDLDNLIKNSDVIVIDSFTKLKEIENSFEVDKNLRKKYNGKLFLIIFQQTTDGKMRGGAKSQFDADIVLFTEKFNDYKNNFVYQDKNRYQKRNIDEIIYNIHKGKILNKKTESKND